MYSTIAVGTDGSRTANVALQTALDLAERCGARVVLVYAYWADDERAREVLGAAAREAHARGIRCESEAVEGSPADVLVEVAERSGADVLVIGNKGMQRRLLGSIPNAVTHHAPCSVWIVKTT